ncbi:unnamed protein product [Cyclocybe aegerita]|uniref:Uncharacterized protein n=1 Tax=Cyclocybe aegerita TaxID=1973307 RepID=A0A8S0WN60_CYCAE|nr:unnamed protein product [Cyclocybe aegerita]
MQARGKAIKTWFGNHKQYKTKNVMKMGRKTSLRQVVGHFRGAEIEEELVRQHPDVENMGQVRFGGFQPALTKVMESLSAEAIAEYRDIGKQWDKRGPPHEVQIKNCTRFGQRLMKNMHEVASKQLGMVSITITSYPKNMMQNGMIFHDYYDELSSEGVVVGNFVRYNHEAALAMAAAAGEFFKYVRQAREGMLSPKSAHGKGGFLWMEQGVGGIPILPPPIRGNAGVELKITQRQILQQFFQDHYQLASGNPSAHPPWEQMRIQGDKFYTAAMVPADYLHSPGVRRDFLFSDPTRMPGALVGELIDHLRGRQAAEGELSFMFTHTLSEGKFVLATYLEGCREACQKAQEFGSYSYQREDVVAGDMDMEVDGLEEEVHVDGVLPPQPAADTSGPSPEPITPHQEGNGLRGQSKDAAGTGARAAAPRVATSGAPQQPQTLDPQLAETQGFVFGLPGGTAFGSDTKCAYPYNIPSHANYDPAPGYGPHDGFLPPAQPPVKWGPSSTPVPEVYPAPGAAVLLNGMSAMSQQGSPPYAQINAMAPSAIAQTIGTVLQPRSILHNTAGGEMLPACIFLPPSPLLPLPSFIVDFESQLGKHRRISTPGISIGLNSHAGNPQVRPTPVMGGSAAGHHVIPDTDSFFLHRRSAMLQSQVALSDAPLPVIRTPRIKNTTTPAVSTRITRSATALSMNLRTTRVAQKGKKKR